MYSKLISVFLCVLGVGINSLASEIFYQDSEYIYRSVPDAIDLTDADLLGRLVEAATIESLAQAELVMNALEIKDYETALDQVQDEISGYLELDQLMEALNSQVDTFKSAKSNRMWNHGDLLPKALTFFIGISGSKAFGISVSGSVAFGLTMMVDKVDRVAKSDLLSSGEGQAHLFSIEEIRTIFGSLDAGFRDSLDIFVGGRSHVVQFNEGSQLKVSTRYELDVAPVIVAAPAVGAGIGAGVGYRAGLTASWWKGNAITEPEDLYGWGMAFSQDMSLVGGINVKAGLVNSDNIDGMVDYAMASAALTWGPQAEFSPIKMNVLYIKNPLWLYKKLGIEEKKTIIFDKQLDTLSSEWSYILKQSGQRKKAISDGALPLQ